MDVLAIILACSLHPDDEVVRTLVDIESSGNTYFVGDLATLKTNDSLKSAEEALRFAEDLRRHGGRPAVGLLGVPLEWASRHGRSPIELFDGCTNVSVATAALAEYHRRCDAGRGLPDRRAAPAQRRRRRPAGSAQSFRYCVVSQYARDLGLATAPAATLKRLIAEHGAPPPDGTVAPPQRSAVLWDGSDAVRSGSSGPPRQRLFLEGSSIAPEGR
jgi:hypothetical protein